MKKVSSSVIIMFSGILAIAQYKPIDIGSSVQFKIKNFGINTNGMFTGLQGNIRFDMDHLNDAIFDVSIDASTINTDNKLRDNHLRGSSFFDIEKYPSIHFVSTKVAPATKSGLLFIFGKITIKNQTKDISFPFTVKAINEGYLFKGTFNLNRKDFGVGGSSVISDNLEVQLSILAKK